MVQKLGFLRHTTPSRGLAYIAATVIMLISAGCLPVRVPTQTTNTSDRKIDLSFLKVGVTTRDEVTRNLTSIDIGPEPKGFFWGRLNVSSWAVVGTTYNKAIGGERTWGFKNLLVDYDHRGIVKSWAIVDDGKLLSHLDLMSNAASAPLDLTSPVLVSPMVTLEAESFDCFDVKVPRNELRKISVDYRSDPDASSLPVTLHFDRQIDFSKTPLRKRTNYIHLKVDPPALLLLYRYVRQTASLNSRDALSRDAGIRFAAATKPLSKDCYSGRLVDAQLFD
jgi:hypothetical protein